MLNNVKYRIVWLVFLSLVTYVDVAYGEGLPPLTHQLTLIDKPILAPELTFKDLDDELVDLKSLKGNVVVINFWATWCPPCRREIGSLERLYQETKDKNVAMLAVNIGEDEDTIFSFLGVVEPSPTFPILLDLNADSMEVWGVKGLPTTYIINQEGLVVYRAVGGREFDHPDIIRLILDIAK